MKKVHHIICSIIGIIGIVLFLYPIIHFKPHDYFYTMNPDIEKYIGVNVVSVFANLSFFTYHTLFFFSLWMIIYGISNLFNLNKLKTFVKKDYIITFVFLNYAITTLLYTVFELSNGNITFGYYGKTIYSIINHIINIFVHYIYFIICLFMFIKIKPNSVSSKSNYIKTLVSIVLYLLTYYFVVKITGRYCYKIIWYPYPIFEPVDVCSLIGIVTNSIFIQYIIYIALLLIILSAYIVSYLFFIKLLKNRISR